ncbi:hypothetical protein ACSBR1_029700 [Camellia fascicularis]
MQKMWWTRINQSFSHSVHASKPLQLHNLAWHIVQHGAAVLANRRFALSPGASTKFSAPPGWSGHFWARTGCNFDSSGTKKYTTGDCGSLVNWW